MKIERVISTEIELIKEIAKKAILESVDASSELKKEIISDTIKHIDKATLNSESVFLKCVGEDVLGFILIQQYWNLSDLFVLPKAHGQGIGRALFKAAQKICQPKQEKDYIRVNSSLNAEGFYRNMGFETFKPEKEMPDFVVPLIYNFRSFSR